MKTVNEKTLAGHIDYAILKADTRLEQVKKLCRASIKTKFNAVCVPPYFVKDAVAFLKNSEIKVTTIIGFPMGYAATPAKAAAVQRAINDGAEEIEVVVNICAIKNNDWNYVRNDIKTMTVAAQMRGKIITAILKIELLNQKEIKELCKICAEEGVDFVKTSTGMDGEKITEEEIKLLRKNLPAKVRIHAFGGIRTAKKATTLLEAGADRIGSLSSLKIVKVA